MNQLVGWVSFALISVLGSAASAADLSLPPVAPIAYPTYNWTGCYVGASGGGIGSNNNFSSWGAGGYLGGQLGCNYQIDHLVIGIEGEGGWVGLNAQTSAGVPGFIATSSAKTNWDADLAARFGIALDRYLPYAKVGAIWMNNSYSTTTGGILGTSTTGSQTLPGFFFGIGLEYAVTPHWVARFESDFAFQNTTAVNFTTTPPTPGLSTTASVNQISFIGKLGASYKFW